MKKTLAIESTGPICSLAYFVDGVLVQSIEHDTPNSHSEVLAPLCESLIQKNGKPDAIALNIGPGSYTGLRIGASLVKGLAYGLNIPVIGINGMACLARESLRLFPSADFIIPCIDARRMEVYQAVYNQQAEELAAVSPLVVNEDSWNEWSGLKVLIGDGADKLTELLAHRGDIKIVTGIRMLAQHQIHEIQVKLDGGEFLDLAYFEPFYLKEFFMQTPNK